MERGHCCGYAMTNDIDDAASSRDRLSGRQPSTDRLCHGHVEWGVLTHRLGIELATASPRSVSGRRPVRRRADAGTPVSASSSTASDQSIRWRGPTGGRFPGA
jgi:hypothetical protein